MRAGIEARVERQEKHEDLVGVVQRAIFRVIRLDCSVFGRLRLLIGRNRTPAIFALRDRPIATLNYNAILGYVVIHTEKMYGSFLFACEILFTVIVSFDDAGVSVEFPLLGNRVNVSVVDSSSLRSHCVVW